MLKRFTYAILSILLALSNLVTVSADYKALTTEENVNVYTLPALSEEQISDQIKTYLMNKYDSDHFQIISYLPESDLKKQSITRSQSQTYIGETTRTVQVRYAKNQYPKGVTFKNTTGTIYYQDSQGADVSFSFSIGGKAWNVGVGLGYKASGVTGYGLNCAANTPCKISVSKSVTVKLYHVVVSYEGQVTSESNVPVKFENALYLRNGLA